MSIDGVGNGAGLEVVDCPVCGPAPSTVWMDEGKPTRYVRCRTCGTVYASPRASHAVRYAWLDQTFGLGANAVANAMGRRPALAQEAALIQNHVREGRMLDIGCDLGDLFEWFAGPAWQRYGVEISPSAARYAAETFAAQVFTGTVHEAAFPNASFDVVTMIDMLYYVEDPRADLQEVARILKPGGLVAIEITGQSYQLRRSRGLLCWLLDHRWTRLYTDSSYLFWFGPEGLQRLLQVCGFEIVADHVIGSPVSSRSWRNHLAAGYCGLISGASRLSRRWLGWAPKHLVLARKMSTAP